MVMIFGQQAIAYRATPAGQGGGVDHETLWVAATAGLPLQCEENAPDDRP